MKNLIFFSLILISFHSFAQKAQVTILDPDINSEELQNEFDVHYGSTHVSSLPDRETREEVFEGIKSIKKWDELKKDIFFMDLKSRSIQDLQSRYPELSVKEIKTLKSRL